MNDSLGPYKPYHFLKGCNEDFQMDVYKLLKQI